MTAFSRKIRSAFGYLIQGDWVHLFNAFTAFLRIRPVLHIGDTRIFTIDSIDHLVARHQTIFEPRGGYEMRRVDDSSIVPDLLKCMEGTSQYPWIRPDERRKKFETMLDRGSRVWVARERSEDVAVSDDVVGFFWETPKKFRFRYGESELEIDLDPDTLYVEFAFVRADSRGRGIFRELISAIHRGSLQCRLLILISEDNTPSIRSITGYGMKPCGRILNFRCFGLMFASFRLGRTRRVFFRIKKGIPYKIGRLEPEF